MDRNILNSLKNKNYCPPGNQPNKVAKQLRPVIKIVLHGSLKTKFGGPFYYGVSTASAAIKSLMINKKGFKEYLEGGNWRLVRCKANTRLKSGIHLSKNTLGINIPPGGELHIIPAGKGSGGGRSGGVVKAVAGAVIAVAAAYFSFGASVAVDAGLGTAEASATGSVAAAGFGWGATIGATGISYGSLATLGAGMFLAGITSIISPQPKTNVVDPYASFLLSGNTNVTQQGVPIPVVYGQTRVGSVVVSLGYQAVDFATGQPIVVTPPPTASDTSGTSGPISTQSDFEGSEGGGGDGGPDVGGGGGSGKKGTGSYGSGQRETPNTLRSNAIVQVVDVLSEGPIGGLVNGPQSIFFNGVPLMASDGTFNFLGVTWQVNIGTTDQAPIPGFPAVSTTVPLPPGVGGGQQVTTLFPYTATIESNTADSILCTVLIPTLYSINSNTGELTSGPDVGINISVQDVTNNGPWILAINELLVGQKNTSPYQATFTVPLPNVGSAITWNIKMERTTPDDSTASTSSVFYWYCYTIQTSHQMMYPNTAYIALTFDAESFGSQIPLRQYEIDGLIINVPANYDAVNRVYATSGKGTSGGSWDLATFTPAVSDNPAWCLYDLIVNSRYGLDMLRYLPSAMDNGLLDLYTIAQYCDAMVPDGFGTGGMIPRYTLDVVMANQDDAYRVIQTMVATFRGMVYWGNGAAVFSADMPKDPVKLINNANVFDGDFSYEGTSLKTRHTVARVTWTNPLLGYLPDVEVYEDPVNIIKYGYRPIDIIAFGCKYRGLAHRLGKWAIYTEQNQTETVTYNAGLYQLDLNPGDIINQVDSHYYSGIRMGGRITAATNVSEFLLDAPFTPDNAQTYQVSVVMPDNTFETKSVASWTQVPGNTIVNLASPFTQLPNNGVEFIITGSVAEFTPQQWIVSALAEQHHGQFSVLAVIHNPSKYDFIENNIALTNTPFTSLASIPSAPLPPPTNVIVSGYMTGVGLTTVYRVTVAFTPAGAITIDSEGNAVVPIPNPRVGMYEVKASSDSGYLNVIQTPGTPCDIDNLPNGNFIFSVRSLSKDMSSASVWVPMSYVRNVKSIAVSNVSLNVVGSNYELESNFDNYGFETVLGFEDGDIIVLTGLTGSPATLNGANCTIKTVTDIAITINIPTNITVTTWTAGTQSFTIADTQQVAGSFFIDNLSVIPQPPTNLSAIGGIRQVSLSWIPAPDRTTAYYNIYRQIQEEEPEQIPNSRYAFSNSSTYTDSDHASLLPDTSVWYWVTTVTSTGVESLPAGPVNTTTSLLVADDIQDGILNNTKFASGLQGVYLWIQGPDNFDNQELPNNPSQAGGSTVITVVNASGNGQLYRWNGVKYEPAVRAPDISGLIALEQLNGSAGNNFINGSQIAPNAITTNNLAVGAASNQIWNPCQEQTSDGWVSFSAVGISYAGPANGITDYNPIIQNAIDPVFKLAGSGTGVLSAATALSHGQTMWSSWCPSINAGGSVVGVPCTPGTWMEVQAKLLPTNCLGQVELRFLDANNKLLQIFQSPRFVGIDILTPGISGESLSNYTLKFAIGQAPTNTAFAQMFIFGLNDDGGDIPNPSQPPFVFWTQAAIGVTVAGATQPQTWQPGGVTSISGGVIKAGSIQALSLAANNGMFNTLSALFASFNGLQSATIAAGAIKASQIAAGAITADALASETLITESAQLGSLVVGTEQVKNLSIGTDQIGIGAVTSTASTTLTGVPLTPSYTTWTNLCSITLQYDHISQKGIIWGKSVSETIVSGSVQTDNGNTGAEGTGGGNGP